MCHGLPCVVTALRGIHIRDNLFRLLHLKVSRGLIDGPAISDIKGTMLSTHDMDDCLKDGLEEICLTQRDLFLKTIGSIEELRSSYQVYRFLRGTSDIQALEIEANGDAIDIVNNG